VREFRGNACTVIHGGFPRTTGYKFVPASRTAALKILDQRLQHFLGNTQSESPGTRTCGDLFEQFVIVRFPKLDRFRKSEYTRYFAYVPPTIPVTAVEKIRKALLERTRESKYSQNTQNRLFTRVRTVFRFGIEQGWLTVNPVHKDMIPSAITSDPTPYTDAEIEAAMQQLSDRHRAFIMFLNSSGCRPIEATRITWNDVYDDHCIVWSTKGATKAIRRRVIPFALCPDAKAAIEMAKDAPWSSPERVFGTATYVKASDAFNAALGEGIGRGLYDIRKAVVSRWMRLGWPEEVRHAIAGHEKSIAEKHYESPFSATELASIVQSSIKEPKRKTKR